MIDATTARPAVIARTEASGTERRTGATRNRAAERWR